MDNSGTPSNPHINAMCDDDGFTQYGMTLRDYFAAKAMQALIAKGGEHTLDAPEQAYYFADKMLKQRENETI